MLGIRCSIDFIIQLTYHRSIIRINHKIIATEVRVLTETGENLGVMTKNAALARAQVDGLDLIEISPNANPPVAKIMDFGKYQYLENKKTKAAVGKTHSTETKSIQVKIGTGDHDLEIKAGKVSEFLREGHRVKVELFLPGRSKYLDPKFLHTRLDRLLKFVSETYRIADPPKRGPKGLTAVIERDK